MRRRARAAIAIAVVGAACWAERGAAAELLAEQISEDTAARLLIGGPDAVGGVGDWYLGNDVVEVIVDDVTRAQATLNHGGTIVDAGLRDRRGEDQFARLFPLANLDQRVLLGFDEIRAEVDPDGAWARIVVTGRAGMSSVARGSRLERLLDPLVPDSDEIERVRAETEYAVFPGEPFVRITTTLHNEGDRPAPVFAYGDVWMRGGRSMRAWVGNTLDPEQTRGFHHVSFDRNALLSSSDPMASFTFVSLPGMRHFPPIAYALFAPERAERGLRSFGVTGEHVTFTNAFVGDPDWRSLGVLRMLGATRRKLEAGESWVYRRRLLVTGHPDVASTTDVLFPALGFADGTSGIRGRIEPADVPTAVHVASAAGWPVTQILSRTRGEDAGGFRAALPPGDYVLTLRAPQRAPRRLEVSVPAGGYRELAVQRLDEPGWLVFGRAFADGGGGRVVVRGIDGTPDPVFGPELLDFRIDGEPAKSGTETRELDFIGGPDDPRRIAIPPGRYRITAVRGLEHDVARVTVDVPGPGSEVEVPGFSLSRVVELRGVVRGDFHVHAQASDDSSTTNESRLRSFIAAGVDVMVTTDHEHLGNYEPALDALGVRDRIRVIQGVEVTSSAPSPAAPWTIGHNNAWPLAYRPLAHRQGAPPSQNMILAELYALLRRDYGAAVVQLNHPRDRAPSERDEGAYLTHLGTAGEGYDPRRPIDEHPNALLLETASDGVTRAVDFDAIEVLNGRAFVAWLRVRDDWYSLLRQGFRVTGTANSDTHGPGKPAGFPRNYVYLDDADWDVRALDEAILAGRLFGTNGPLVSDFRANGGRIGDLVPAPSGDVLVEFAVAAAPWVPVDEVRLLVNGEVVETLRDLDDGVSLRVQESRRLRLEADGFVTLEAGVPLDADRDTWLARNGGVYADVVAPGYLPTAFTNPIFLDVDGDGGFDPPGLPPAPTSRRSPVLWLLPVALLLALVAWLRRQSRRPHSPAADSR